MSKESRDKISRSLTGRKASNITIERLRISHLGINVGDKNPMKLMKNRLKISEYMKFNNPMKDKIVSQETKDKISVSISKFKTGRSLPTSHKENIAKSKQKKILNITTGEIYESSYFGWWFWYKASGGHYNNSKTYGHNRR